MQISILQTNKIKKIFSQNNSSLEVLKGITYSFEQNQSYAITAVSGSGKTTLMHILAGIDSPTAGDILFNDLNINKFNKTEKNFFLNESIGLVFQEPYLIKEFTVIENIMIKGLIKKWNYEYCEKYAMDLLCKINLAHKAHDFPAMLSGGQQQRVSILRAIFNKPKFLLADEPTGNLDKKTSCEIKELLIECKENWNMGLIISTHDNDLANATQNILQLKDGLLVKY